MLRNDVPTREAPQRPDAPEILRLSPGSERHKPLPQRSPLPVLLRCLLPRYTTSPEGRKTRAEMLLRFALPFCAFAAAMPSVLSTDFSRYHANDSLIGQPVPCTDAEKECLRHNRLLHLKSGHCYPMGHGPRDCRFFVDRREYEHGRGHLRGACAKDPCPGGKYLMAYDGKCVQYKELIRICRGADNLEFTPHFFGATECVRVEFHPPPPVYVAQPEEAGKCVFPNLRHDMTSVRAMEARRIGIHCHAAQSVCFEKGQVWYEPHKACFPLLEKGPCEEGEQLVLEVGGSRAEKKLHSRCAPRNPCKSNQRLMAFDGRCHDASEIRMVLCPTGVLLPNAYGQMSCSGVKDMYKHVIVLESARVESCEVVHKVSHSINGPGVKVVPDCSLSGAGVCSHAVNELMRSAVGSVVDNNVPVF